MSDLSRTLVATGNNGRDNKYQYNGIEHIDEYGLMTAQARYRSLDLQLGLWHQVDPKAEAFYGWSPYHSNLGNPIRYDDPEGDCPWCPVLRWVVTRALGETGKSALKGAVGGMAIAGSFEAGMQMVSNARQFGVGLNFDKLGYYSIKVSTLSGAVGGGMGGVISTRFATSVGLGFATSRVSEFGVGAGESYLKQKNQNEQDGTGISYTKMLRDGAIDAGGGAYFGAGALMAKQYTGLDDLPVLMEWMLNGTSEGATNTFQYIADEVCDDAEYPKPAPTNKPIMSDADPIGYTQLPTSLTKNPNE